MALAKEIAESLVKELRNAVALQQMHEKGAYETQVPGAFNNSFEAWGYNVTINSLHNDLVMTPISSAEGPNHNPNKTARFDTA